MRTSVEPSLDAADYPFSHRIRVRFAETDAMGIVHHADTSRTSRRRESRTCVQSATRTRGAEAGVEMAVLEAFVSTASR